MLDILHTILCHQSPSIFTHFSVGTVDYQLTIFTKKFEAKIHYYYCNTLNKQD